MLLGLRASYIPMAPNTAIGFVLMGLGLLATAGGKGRAAVAMAGIVGAIAALTLVEFATGADLAVDRLFLRIPTARFGLAPLGQMAPSTAAAFVAACASIVLLASGRASEAVADLAGAAALAAGGTGLVFALGYLFSPNAPLLYGTQSIPMALNTALGFDRPWGRGWWPPSVPGAFPLRRLCRPVDARPAARGSSCPWWWRPSAWSPGSRTSSPRRPAPPRPPSRRPRWRRRRSSSSP